MKIIILQFFFILISITNLFAIDIDDIDIGDSYYAVLGEGQYIYDSILSNNQQFSDLSMSDSKKILNNIRKVVIVRIKKKDDSLKIRFNDNTVDWFKVNYMLTKNEMNSIKTTLETLVYNEEKRNKKYCCCSTTMTNWWDMTFNKKLWIETTKCNNGWKGYAELGGGLNYHPGTCTKYTAYDSGSCR